MADEGRSDLVSTTDCLEAISVLKGWKNFFFVIILICLFILEASFWVIDANLVEPNSIPAPEKQPQSQSIISSSSAPLIALAATAEKPTVANEPNSPAKAADANAATSDANTPAKPQTREIYQVLNIRFAHVAWVIRVFNFILIFALLLYCLTILFSVKVSLVGRLGGINHIMRAFFLSLIVLILALPWQNVFGSAVTGWIYSPAQLIASKAKVDQNHTVLMLSLFYLRYAGLWVLLLGLVILAQLRTNRWSKATMRRLGVL